VATSCLNVAIGSFSKSYISVERFNKLQFLQHISLNCGDSKETVATKVANVATGTFWLDIADLNCDMEQEVYNGGLNIIVSVFLFEKLQSLFYDCVE
jgi:hypothetical protein